jgi:alcohol dehydrogenase
MKAAVLEEFGRPLTICDVVDPHIGSGEVLVDVLATCVAPYAAEVFSGARNYPLEPPVISGVGGIGRVIATGPDATRLRPGDRSGATRRSARATMPRHRTSPCRAGAQPVPAA